MERKRSQSVSRARVCARAGGGPGEDEGTVAGHADAETGVFGPTAAEDRL